LFVAAGRGASLGCIAEVRQGEGEIRGGRALVEEKRANCGKRTGVKAGEV